MVTDSNGGSFGRNFAAAQATMAACLTDTKLVAQVHAATATIVRSVKNGGKVLVFGNGGSAAQAQHFAAELVGWYADPMREGYPAIALTTDGSVLTAVANDSGYALIFDRQVRALVRPGDVVIGISTSGKSENVCSGLWSTINAWWRDFRTIALTAGDGGLLKAETDVLICVPSEHTPRIQEAHLVILHTIAEMVEQAMKTEA